MPAKPNPLKLNSLQLRTLCILQQLARTEGAHEPDPGGGVRILGFPRIHGDHFHVGDAVVMRADASGLGNPAVWNALARKGLARGEFGRALSLTEAGAAYDTGVETAVLLRADH